MADDVNPCSCVADSSGLHAIATASGNVRAVLLEKLSQGAIGVPVCALHEFQELFEEEAAILLPHIKHKIVMKKTTYVGAARIADQMNQGFSRGPHDTNVELYTASVAVNGGYKVLTSLEQIGGYEKMGCEALDPQTFVDGLGLSS